MIPKILAQGYGFRIAYDFPKLAELHKVLEACTHYTLGRNVYNELYVDIIPTNNIFVDLQLERIIALGWTFTGLYVRHCDKKLVVTFKEIK